MDIKDMGKTALVSLFGWLDVDSAPEVRDKLVPLIDGGKTNVVINLNKVDYVDSAGVSALISILRTAQRKNAVLRFAAVQPQVMELFEDTSLVKAFDIYDTEQAALEGLDQ